MSLAKFSSYFNNPIAELEEEIGRLEVEIVSMERRLLDLYRTALDGRIMRPIDGPKRTVRRSLADHLGGARNEYPDANQLSEQILSCVASTYCKVRGGSITGSPMSSSSPPYDMIRIIDVRLDNERTFNQSAAALERMRSLVTSLEKVDPRKMTRESKIAFWINIHNAMLMHAYLAYGIGNRASAFKAVYNVGGHRINAQIIQSSILRIRSQNSEPWLQGLLSGKSGRHEYALDCPEPLVHFALASGDRLDPPVRVYTAKHILGELRVAKEEYIKARVEILKEDKETKVLFPRVLYFYAKDASLDMRSRLVQWLPQNNKFGYLIHPHLANNIDSP